MRDTVPDLEVGDTTDPQVPEPIEHERTEVFARPSEVMSAFGGDARLTWPDDAQVVDAQVGDAQVVDAQSGGAPVVDARARARTASADSSTALGSQPYAIQRLRSVKRSAPPPDPPRRDSPITEFAIRATLDAVLRRSR